MNTVSKRECSQSLKMLKLNLPKKEQEIRFRKKVTSPKILLF